MVAKKKTESTNVQTVLQERNSTHGDWVEQATHSQRLKETLQVLGFNWSHLQPWQKESLEMIMVKISRIMNGDCNHVDSWQDIAGYAMLVANELEKRIPVTKEKRNV